jgi:hypothetical protein
MPAPSATVDPALSGQSPSSGELADLILEVRDLRQRVMNLESCVGTAMATPAAMLESTPLPPVVELPRRFVPANTVAVLGRMLIAIAGAYVLRALTEWGVLPAGVGVAMGLIYALIWLLVAARLPGEAKFAAALSCSTSVLIMAPLFWEATSRLKVISSGMSAAALAAFALIGLALGSRTRHRIIATIAGLASIAMAFALLLARDDMVPFITALLAIAAAMECAAWRDLRPGVRAFAALAADASVLLFSFLMSSPRAMPESWVPVPTYAVLVAQLALALIYIATAVTQTIVRRRTLAFAEMAQTAVALATGIGGAVWVFRDHRALMLGLGLVALAGGLACYAVSFRLFESDNKWNFRAWATFGLFLVLAGEFLPFSRAGFWVFSCACAAACCWTAKAFRLPTLGVHGAVYLLLGSAAAGATGHPLQVLFGPGSGPLQWQTSIVVLLAAVVCWVAIANVPLNGQGRWRKQISSLAIAAQAVWITMGLAVFALVSLWPEGPRDTFGTVVITALSLALAWAGTRWARPELVWLLYGFLVLGGYKLGIRDFMNERNIALVVSLLCYGGALMVLPGMLRGRSGGRGGVRSWQRKSGSTGPGE